MGACSLTVYFCQTNKLLSIFVDRVLPQTDIAMFCFFKRLHSLLSSKLLLSSEEAQRLIESVCKACVCDDHAAFFYITRTCQLKNVKIGRHNKPLTHTNSRWCRMITYLNSSLQIFHVQQQGTRRGLRKSIWLGVVVPT